MSSPGSIPVIQQARQQLQQVLKHYQQTANQTQGSQQLLRATIQQELEKLTTLNGKLDERLISIAAFGLVSRGKSAVLNALVGQKLLQTGPVHGVTRWPRAVRWSPSPDSKIVVELIDTPGLNEIEGQERTAMAQQVSQQADLILFVVAGDITQTEYQAIQELLQFQKPLLLVFNKIDLYPPPDQVAIVEKLQHFLHAASDENGSPLNSGQTLSDRDILRVAAEPAPIQVRVELPDSEVRYEWETPPPQIQELRERLLELLNCEGQALLALNVMVQAREAEQAIAYKTVELRQKEAEELLWKFMGYKAIAIALNPLTIVDLVGSLVTDLALIRGLSRLYALPMTNHEVGTLWQKLLWSGGLLLVGEWGGDLVFGVDRSLSILDPGQFAACLEAAIVQASVAGYGSYVVGRAAQRYLKQGCTWGPTGASTLIQTILRQAKRDTVLHRLRAGIQQNMQKSLEDNN